MKTFPAKLIIIRTLWILLVYFTVKSHSKNHVNKKFFSFGKWSQISDKLIDKANNLPSVVLVSDWPKVVHHFGQISAVAVEPSGNPVVLQRADRYWTKDTFNDKDIYTQIQKGPIVSPTLHILDVKNGSVVYSWAAYLFYLPHGLTIDNQGYYWVTDVAMHQVFKLKPFSATPLLILGKRFTPGNEKGHFCKPTSVAVANNGEFFVADGYCNKRIIKFNSAGQLKEVFPAFSDAEIHLNVPHSIILLEHLNLLCIADRDNWRVVCIPTNLKSKRVLIKPSPDQHPVYGVASLKKYIFVINGSNNTKITESFLYNPLNSSFHKNWGLFHYPHSISTSHSENNLTSLYIVDFGISTDRSRIWKYVVLE